MLNIKRPEDAVLYLFSGLILIGVAYMIRGYAILIRQALSSADRREALKRVYDWRGCEHLVDPRGPAAVYKGAKIIFVGWVGFWLLVFLTPLRH